MILLSKCTFIASRSMQDLIEFFSSKEKIWIFKMEISFDQDQIFFLFYEKK
jgi:hypothetical protein